MENQNNYILDFDDHVIKPLPLPISTICIGGDTGVQVNVDKKFNWFQKKMIKWCFGFEVKENDNGTI